MLQKYDVRIKTIENGRILASIMAWDTAGLVEIPKHMVSEEFVTSLFVHVANGNVEKSFHAPAMLNLEAKTVDELFDGAYFVS